MKSFSKFAENKDYTFSPICQKNAAPTNWVYLCPDQRAGVWRECLLCAPHASLVLAVWVSDLCHLCFTLAPLFSLPPLQSNFVVTKKYKTGDGMFFQWTMASGIFVMGIFFYIYQCGTLKNSANNVSQCPSFQPFAMLGGAVWATGNVLTVPIVKTIGLSLGLLTWGMANMVVGWASARFGILGVFEQPISQPALNMVGVVIAVLSMGVFALIKPSVEPKGAQALDAEHSAQYGQIYDADADELGKSLVGGVNSGGSDESGSGEAEEQSWTDKLSPLQKTIFGFGASVAAGLLYGLNFNPPTYVANHMCMVPPACFKTVPATCDWSLNAPGCYNGTGNDWDSKAQSYVFSHFTGIWLSSSLYFLLYCALTKNTPAIFGEATFPGIVSGMIWATAQVSWFFANSALGQATSFPIIS